jgi:hypothetical protein
MDRHLTKVSAMNKRTIVSYTPGSDWLMIRGKKLMAATKVGKCVSVGVWKEQPRARGEMKDWSDGQELRLTPEEALDLAYAIGLIAREIDPNAKKNYRRWLERGRQRPPALKVIRGGAREE